MELTDCYEVWLLSWQPGQGTGFHDHGGSRGAFAVAWGDLQEQTVRDMGQVVTRTVTGGQVRSFGARFIHHVANNGTAPAVSVHAYSPPLPPMRRYELAGGRLRYTGTEPAEQPGPPAVAGTAGLPEVSGLAGLREVARLPEAVGAAGVTR
jgi:hypothetical protein